MITKNNLNHDYLAHFHALQLVFWQYYHEFVSLLKIEADPILLWEDLTRKPFTLLKKALVKSNLHEKICHKTKKIDPVEEYTKVLEQAIEILTLCSDRFPNLLKEIHTPPLVLYCKGKLSHDWQRSISIVGTRQPSTYGKIQTDLHTEFLLHYNFLIVSGFALGIDSIAHLTCLKGSKPTIAVLGSGIENIYPASNRRFISEIIENGGAIISEYPPKITANPGNFPRRNRIVSGLTRATYVIEGKEHSGALITARYALEQGREVLALPGDINRDQSYAPNFLIKKSMAHPISKTEDILDILNIPKEETNSYKTECSSNEKNILQALKDEPLTVDEIIQKTSLSSSVIQVSLSCLELKKIILQDAGKFFLRKILIF